jgi:hypothetical protein
VSRPKLVLVGDGSPQAPFATLDEATVAAQEAWRRARTLHLQILAKASEPSMLRLHNGGALPHEDRDARDITGHTLSGLAKDLRKIEQLAAEAAAALEDTAVRARGR